MKLSRRRFLLGTGAFVASAALPALPVVQPEPEIVGTLGTVEGITFFEPRYYDLTRAAIRDALANWVNAKIDREFMEGLQWAPEEISQVEQTRGYGFILVPSFAKELAAT